MVFLSLSHIHTSSHQFEAGQGVWKQKLQYILHPKQQHSLPSGHKSKVVFLLFACVSAQHV